MAKFKFAPLSGGYMAGSMLGIFISLMYVYKQAPDWGITFTVAFTIMFIASVVSMTAADPDEFIELETRNKKKSRK
jgi:hypothetical protein